MRSCSVVTADNAEDAVASRSAERDTSSEARIGPMRRSISARDRQTSKNE
jgi:hypothetical protein